MFCEPKLSYEDFKQVHNGKYHIMCALERLEGVVAPEIYKLLEQGYNELKSGLENAYKQEDIEYKRKSRHYTDVAREHQLNSIWSLYEIDDLSAEHPDKGAHTLVYEEHWGNVGPVEVPIEGPTWADLYRAADRAIGLSGDQHHVFIEAFKLGTTGVLKLSTGS